VKTKTKYDKKLDEDAKSKTIDRAKKRYTNALHRRNIHEEIANEEIRKLSNYKLSDIKAEKVAVGKAVAANTLMTLGSYAGAAAGGLPFYVISVPNISATKTNHRVNTSTQREIIRKARSDAEEEVRRQYGT
jgi:hypothetical protein